MEKRGQLTIFIILGVIILVVFAILYLTIYRPSPLQPVPEQFSEVQKYVDDCVKQTLRDGIAYFGRGPNFDYENSLAGYIKDYLVYCPDFIADFPDLVVSPKDVTSVKVSFNDDKTVLSAVVIYPLTVSKGISEKTLDRFYADYNLIQKGCASIPTDAYCKYSGASSVEVKIAGITFNFNPGDFVGVGGSCIAC